MSIRGITGTHDFGTVFHVNVTSFCNYRCHYCLAWSTHVPAGRATAFRTQPRRDNHIFAIASPERWANRFQEIAPGKKSLEYNGGEPFLDFEPFVELLRRTTELPDVDYVRVLTNAYWDARKIKDLDTSNIYLIVGYHPAQTEFEPWLRRVLRIRDRGFEVDWINFTMAPGQRHLLPKLAERLSPYHLSVMPAIFMDHTGLHPVSERDRELYMHLLPARDVGFKTRGINPKGNPCWWPSTNYDVVGRKIFRTCVDSQSRDVFDEDPPPLPKGPVICPSDSCVFQCKYSMLVDSPCMRIGESNTSRYFTANVRRKWASVPEVVASALKQLASEAPETPEEREASRSAAHQTTALIAGHYGMGNAGEEAALSGVLSGLRDVAAGLRTIVVSHDPEETSDTHRTVAVGWTSLSDLARSGERADAIVISGTLVRSCFPARCAEDPSFRQETHVDGPMLLSVLSALLRKPLVILGADVANLVPSGDAAIRLAMLKSAALLIVFGEDAARRLEGLGIDRERIRRTASPVLLLEAWPRQLAEEILLDEGVSTTNGPLVAVVLDYTHSQASSEETLKQVGQALDDFVTRHDARVLFIPFRKQTSSHRGDRFVLKGLRSSMRHADRGYLLPDFYTTREKLGVISLCRLVLTNCPEAVPFAIRSNVPAVAYVDGSPAKAGDGMLSQADFPFTPSDADGRSLLETLEACYACKTEAGTRPDARLSALQQEARKSFQYIADVCQRAQDFSSRTFESSREVWAECILAIVKRGWSPSELETQTYAMNMELERIERDPVWLWIQKMRRLRKRLAPDGSKRHRLFNGVANRVAAVIAVAKSSDRNEQTL